jgi:ABC-type transporter Mla maintaining outer membrane lipid asymmetry ATPase subunit MlaF
VRADVALPLVEFHGVSKQYGAPQPLRLDRLIVTPGERLSVSGLDVAAAEMFVLLITGAALPDEGDVRIDGRSTAAITTDVDWLQSLDRFGLVTERAVLIDKLPAQANMALPFTLSIDPLSEETRTRVAALGAEVGLSTARLETAAGELSPADRLRVHLARALALDPRLVLLEHPTTAIRGSEEARAYGNTLRAVADARRIGWIAVTDDAAFARASGATRLRLSASTGALRRDGLLGRWVR